jgi:putative membrane protein insertion efficiency factor
MKKLILFLLSVYKKTFSLALRQILGPGCRFSPTCAEYAKEAVENFGVIHGGALTIKRLVKCHPFTSEHLDPLPEKV